MIFSDFSGFHTAGIKKRKKKEKTFFFLFGTEPGWATAQLSLGLGVGARRCGRWGAQAWALGRWAGRWARGRVAGAGHAWARGPALQAARRAVAGRSGRAGVRSRRGARKAGRAAGRAR